MTTPRDIIYSALKDTGVLAVGQDPLAEDVNDSLRKMNFMIAQWRRKRWLIYHLLDLSIVSNGAISYTIGPGGDIERAARPDRIEAAYIRFLNNPPDRNVDYPLTLISAMEDYSRLALKNLQSTPYYLFYDSGFPLGKLFPWPVPQASLYELHVLVKADLDMIPMTPAGLSTDFAIPEEYLAALHYNLVVRLCPGYGKTVPTEIAALAVDSLEVLRKANVQVPTLQMPPELRTPPRAYNPYGNI